MTTHTLCFLFTNKNVTDVWNFEVDSMKMIWFRDGYLNAFRVNKPFMEGKGGLWPDSPRVTPWSVLLNASYHQFPRFKPFYEVEGVGMPPRPSWCY